ncbi:MAG: hypothetical protein ACSLFP_16140, partial [Acidimicrobiales bacterium]
PDEEAQRRTLAAQRRPRILVVGPSQEPPDVVDELEDWLRDPPEAADLMARIASLGQRAERLRARPRLDDDGLLWHDQRWVAIPDAQLCVAELLLQSADELVRTEVIATTYVRHGGSGHRASVKTMLNRLQGRFAEVGLQLHFLRGKGVLLEVPTGRSA